MDTQLYPGGPRAFLPPQFLLPNSRPSLFRPTPSSPDSTRFPTTPSTYSIARLAGLKEFQVSFNNFKGQKWIKTMIFKNLKSKTRTFPLIGCWSQTNFVIKTFLCLFEDMKSPAAIISHRNRLRTQG